MSRSTLRNQYMVFETPIDNRFPLPLTLEAALEDCTHAGQLFDPPRHGLRYRRSERSLPVAPPSTRKNSFEYFDYNTLEKARGESFSSSASTPGMVEDHSGVSDSDAETPVEYGPYEETMDRLWDTYRTLQVQGDHSEAALFYATYLPDHLDDSHLPPPLLGPEPRSLRKTSDPQIYSISRPSKNIPPDPRSSIPAPSKDQSNITTLRQRNRGPYEGQPFAVSNTENGNQSLGLRRSHAQRSARQTNTAIKSPRPALLKGEGCSVRPELQKRSKSLSPIHPMPPPQNRFYGNLPYQAHPAINPCNSSHSYSIHNTPPLTPLPLLEKSVFDYDTENDGDRNLSSSITSKLHIRGFSLSSKLGFTSKKEKDGRMQNAGRRRSASDIVRGVFGRSRK